MKTYIKHFANFYLYSSLHIALCAGALTYFTYIKHQIPVDNQFTLFIVFSTLFIYSLHRYVGIIKVEPFSFKGRFLVINQFQTHILIYLILSGLIAFYMYIYFDLLRMSLLLIGGLISILYTLPIFNRGMRLRDIGWYKIFLIAIVWSWSTETIMLIENGFDPLYIGISATERILYFIALTLPFDIRDLQIDSHIQVKTIPMVIGRSNTYKLSYLLLLICIGLQMVFASSDHLWSPISMISISTYLVTALAIQYTRNKIHDFYYSGLLDGLIMLPYLLYLMVR